MAEDAFHYPDVQVVCDPADVNEAHKSRLFLAVEVLSPSTAAISRREKLLAYRRLESLRGYVVVYQDEYRVARHWRDEREAWWQAEVHGEDLVPFPCPERELSLAEIYEGLPPLPR